MALFHNEVIHKVQAVANWESYNHSAFIPRPDRDTDAAGEVNANSIVIPGLGVGVGIGIGVESQHI